MFVTKCGKPIICFLHTPGKSEAWKYWKAIQNKVQWVTLFIQAAFSKHRYIYTFDQFDFSSFKHFLNSPYFTCYITFVKNMTLYLNEIEFPSFRMFWVMFGWDLIDKKIINCEQYIFNISLLSQIGEGNGPLSD